MQVPTSRAERTIPFGFFECFFFWRWKGREVRDGRKNERELDDDHLNFSSIEKREKKQLTQAHGALRVLFDLVQANLDGPVFEIRGAKREERVVFVRAKRALINLRRRRRSRPPLLSGASNERRKKKTTHLSAQKDFAMAPGDVGSSS